MNEILTSNSVLISHAVKTSSKCDNCFLIPTDRRNCTVTTKLIDFGNNF